ncbi:NAD-glutamate dehydrogenase, partial [Aliifodinibius sp. S!AR15-10]|uniref:hypothetical protein n=1 Tax=Aliifodinibius sp. S!AR15-10 TaxID=2950437 RepID=UPI00285DCC93
SGKRSEGVKKETMREISVYAERVENLHLSGGLLTGTYGFLLSHTAVGTGEEIPAGDFLGSFLFIQKGTPLERGKACTF